MLFQFLCALEDDDRLDVIVKQVWPEFWKALGLGKDAQYMEPVISSVESAGLVYTQDLGGQVKYIIHPGIAKAGLVEVEPRRSGDEPVCYHGRPEVCTLSHQAEKVV